MLALLLILRWMHILGAAILVGGTIFLRYAHTHAQATLPDDSRQRHAAELRSQWSRLVIVSSGLLLLSGLINFTIIVSRFDFSGSAFPGNAYHPIFGIKFLLALAVFVIAGVLSGRSAAAEQFRRKEKFWLTINAVLAVAVVCLGGMLKMAERSARSADSSSAGAAAMAVGHAGHAE